MIVVFLLLVVVLFVCVEQYCRRNKKTLLEHLHPDWYKDVTVFPEYAFPPRVNHTEYKNTIDRGRVQMSNRRVIFAGLCINIESKVPNLLKRLRHLGGFFKDYQCVIFENDSTDNTRQLLMGCDDRIHLVPCEEEPNCKLKQAMAITHGMFSTGRIKKMTEYRNRLLEHIKKRFSDYDCVCMIDLDIEGPIDIRGIAHSFGLYNTWDSISAYGLSGSTISLGYASYYDTLAYKDDNFDLGISKLHILPILFKTNMYRVGDFPYKVQSGFCGLALYKMNSIRHIDYTPKDDTYVCEHVTLHANMIDNGFDRIFINPNMLVLVGAQSDVENLPLY